MLTDNPNTKHRKPKIRPVDGGNNRTWSDKQKIEAVTTYLSLGNLALTSRILAIPEITLRVWKTTEWWKSLVEEMKQQETIEMSSKLKKIVEASLSAVTDRLEHGDVTYDQKTGALVRKPVNMKDAHKVAVDLMSKRDILEKAAKPQEEQQQDEDRLLKLAEKFATFVTQKNKPVIEVTDVIEIEPLGSKES